MTPSKATDWHSLAEQASNEMDADKLLNLVTQLNRVLGEQQERSRAQRRQRTEFMTFSATV
ncbi:MAG: hypothetical protein DMG85_12230 [Acidobacteria bacterium]|nr:MAG: hypothetical protein DMG85_12230 [Acidobacteriota bacterium]